MAEVLAQFTDPIRTTDGVTYFAQACGAPNADGLWEGWIEFRSPDGHAVRSPRETTQPNRTDAEYWASGLSEVYLQGALDRALNPIVRVSPARPRPMFPGPAPDLEIRTAERATGNAVLDPFSVYEKGETILRQELGALSEWHLVNIIVGYRLSDEPVSVLNKIMGPALVELIVSRVREHELTR